MLYFSSVKSIQKTAKGTYNCHPSAEFIRRYCRKRKRNISDPWDENEFIYMINEGDREASEAAENDD